jgi:beta-lactamase regulating signal transducer with metallopeptidase domain
MALSYTLRLVCLIVVSTGILQTALDLILWIGSPFLLGRLTSLPARQQERLLYLLQLTPFVGAALLTSLLCVPQYLHTETNLAPEKVGWLCLLLAAMVVTWFGFAALRSLRIAVRTMHFSRACRRSGQIVRYADNHTPIYTFQEGSHRVALVGLFNPFVCISRHLMEDGSLSALALDVVLGHERSHALHRDNWKLLSLHAIPRLNLTLPGGGTWMRHWQSAAEWAADDDAVQGDSTRAFLLAETLVALTRQAAVPIPGMICTGLVCGGSEFARRIDRLIQRVPPCRPQRSFPEVLVLAAMALGAALAIATLSPWLQNLSERLLHLG